MKKFIIASAALIASGSSALAVGIGSGASTVPEISALEGTAAVAALVAVVLIAWERRRRAA